MRRPPSSLDGDAEAVLVEALEACGLQLVPPPESADLSLDLGAGQRIDIEVKSLSQASPSRVRSLIARHAARPVDGRVLVVVADTVPAGARKLLEDASMGWLDRRGQLRLSAPGLRIHTDVEPAPRAGAGTASTAPISGTAGLATALQLLMNPGVPLRVRRTAELAGLSPSAISRALARLRGASLLHRSGAPLLPDLFWALADAWPHEAGALIKRTPDLDHPRADEMRMNAMAVAEPGWALTGTRGALAWGVPLVASSSYPAELLLPDDAAVRRARQRFGDATSPHGAAASVRAAPNLLAVRQRVKTSEPEQFPLAHPVVIALDLSADHSRGIEALEAWSPPAPYERVW